MTTPYAWHIINGGEPCALSYGNPENDGDYKCCDIASVQVGNLEVCEPCAKFLHSIGIGV
jgi:hypothetical protein